MRALTLTQPWAGLVASGIKLVENRPRPIIKGDAVGTQFAIHASREIVADTYQTIYEIAPELDEGGDEYGAPWHILSKIPSAIIAVATLESVFANPSVLPPDQRRWYFGPIGYVLKDVRALAEPVPCRGWQGFWALPADIEAKVRSQL